MFPGGRESRRSEDSFSSCRGNRRPWSRGSPAWLDLSQRVQPFPAARASVPTPPRYVPHDDRTWQRDRRRGRPLHTAAPPSLNCARPCQRTKHSSGIGSCCQHSVIPGRHPPWCHADSHGINDSDEADRFPDAVDRNSHVPGRGRTPRGNTPHELHVFLAKRGLLPPKVISSSTRGNGGRSGSTPGFRNPLSRVR